MHWIKLLFACFSCSFAQRGAEDTSSRSQAITEDVCSSLGFNTSPAPYTSDGGTPKVEFYGYKSLLQRHCSNYFMTFLCGVYFPNCSGDSRTCVYPCKSLCKAAKSECEQIMSDFGLAWPKKFNCKRYRKNGNCVSVNLDGHGGNLPEPMSTPPTSCERITIPLCQQSIGYNYTHYPTSRHQSQEDAAVEISIYYPVEKVGCSRHTLTFLCSYYAPECSDGRQEIPPCRSLCQAVKNGCEELLRKFSFSWPFDCDNLPTANCRELPNESQEADDGEDGMCEPITVSFCSGVGYNFTHFPNSRSARVEDSDSTLLSYTPLVQLDCHENLRTFLCGSFVPSCTEYQTEILPCREMCEDVKTACLPIVTSFGFTWPDTLACESFPSANSDRVCLAMNQNAEEIQSVTTDHSSMESASRHLGQIQEGIELLQGDLRLLAEDREEDRREELSLILAGLKDSVSGLLSNAKGISTFLEAYQELT